jgi:hypothetical protein
VVGFRPDPSNGGYGHIGIALGGGHFSSATTGGVTVDGPSRYWSSRYAGRPDRVGEDGRPEVFVPEQNGRLVPNGALRHGGTDGASLMGGGPAVQLVQHIHINPVDGDDKRRVAQERAGYVKAELDRLVSLRLG